MDRLKSLRVPPPAGWVALAVVAALAPLVAGGYVLSVATTVLTFAMLGLGLNVVVGYAGLLDLGYAAFFAIGAYVSSLLTLHAGFSFWETLPVAMVATAIAGCIIGYPTLRLRSDYLAIVTLGFGEIVRIIATNLAVTGGPNGLTGIPPASIGGTNIVSGRALYYLGLAFTVVALAFTWLLSRSWLGHAWRALREDETAAEAVGVPTVRVKLLAYVMGALVGGLAGPFIAARFGAVDPTSFTFLTSVQILIVVIVGGMGSLSGVILGAVVVVAGPEALRAIADYRLLVFAIALIVLMLVRPQGLWPAPRPRWGAPRRRPGLAGRIRRRAARATTGRRAAARGEELLRVSGLSHSFGGVHAVADLDLVVNVGEILSVIGPNGAGKTTVFNCVTGVVQPDRGTITLRGRRSLRGLRPHRVVHAGLARTFQGIRLFDGLTVAENVLIGRYQHRHQGDADAEVVRWLEFVGLSDRATALARELAYGERRRVEIARALASDPLLLLLDEPAAGANPTEKNELMGLIRRVRDLGITVVLIEHDMTVVMGLSDRVVVMDQGRKIAEGTPAEVRGDPRVIEAYLGREDEAAEMTVEEVLGWHS